VYGTPDRVAMQVRGALAATPLGVATKHVDNVPH
jgi:hypothetical protein